MFHVGDFSFVVAAHRAYYDRTPAVGNVARSDGDLPACGNSAGHPNGGRQQPGGAFAVVAAAVA